MLTLKEEAAECGELHHRAVRRLGQADCEYKVSLDCRVTFCVI